MGQGREEIDDGVTMRQTRGNEGRDERKSYDPLEDTKKRSHGEEKVRESFESFGISVIEVPMRGDCFLDLKSIKEFMEERAKKEKKSY